MKLTVVTTTYNQEKYIEKAIKGIVTQKTSFDFKLVISDDCSTDNTKEIIKKYKRKYPNKIELIENPKNLGAMGNFIHTLSQIKNTEYVALCDGDDFWIDENKLQKQVDFLDENRDFSICFHKSKLFYQNKEKEDEIIPKGIEEITTIEDLVKQNYVIANSVVYRWAFNENNLEEIFPKDIAPGDYYVHLLHAQYGKIKMFDEVMSAYRRHKDGMWWSNDDTNKEKFTLEYGRKFLNFYNAADKYMNLPENSFYAQRKDIIYNMIVTYIKGDKFNELLQNIISNKDKELFYENLKDIVNRNIWFQDYLRQKEKEQKEIQKIRQDAQKLNMELNAIKNSRWWKLRNKIKGCK